MLSYVQFFHIDICSNISYWQSPCKVKIGVSHHSINAARDQLTLEKSLIFVAEPPKGDEDDGKKKRKKKAKKDGVSANSFGSFLNFSKFKGNQNFVVGFRCRLGTYQDHVGTTRNKHQ